MSSRRRRRKTTTMTIHPVSAPTTPFILPDPPPSPSRGSAHSVRSMTSLKATLSTLINTTTGSAVQRSPTEFGIRPNRRSSPSSALSDFSRRRLIGKHFEIRRVPVPHVLCMRFQPHSEFWTPGKLSPSSASMFSASSPRELVLVLVLLLLLSCVFVGVFGMWNGVC
ncbi:hypothetical protein B0H14DRAFT_2715305 [Mycena olivaceomarginata]|nr:hypothetical protein B0H14DRAFT_2715305 [Mycena olivaceomarginata]